MTRELPEGLFESFWIVYSIFGNFKDRFYDYEEACKTAEQMAAVHPLDAFFVMESRCLVRANVSTTRRYAVNCASTEQASEPT